MSNTNEAVGVKNNIIMSGIKKRLVIPFKRQNFWKFIGCIQLEGTYRKKGHKLWSEVPNVFGKKTPTKLQKYAHRNTDLNKLCCDLYCTINVMLEI